MTRPLDAVLAALLIIGTTLLLIRVGALITERLDTQALSTER